MWMTLSSLVVTPPLAAPRLTLRALNTKLSLKAERPGQPSPLLAPLHSLETIHGLPQW